MKLTSLGSSADQGLCFSIQVPVYGLENGGYVGSRYYLTRAQTAYHKWGYPKKVHEHLSGTFSYGFEEGGTKLVGTQFVMFAGKIDTDKQFDPNQALLLLKEMAEMLAAELPTSLGRIQSHRVTGLITINFNGIRHIYTWERKAETKSA